MLADGLATVRVEGSVCSGCSHSGTCGLFSASGAVETITVRNPLNARPGEKVRLVLSSAHTLQSAGLLYLLPGVCILVGVLAGARWGTSLLAIPEELAGMLGGLAMLVVGWIPAVLRSRSGNVMPVVTAVVKEE